MKPTAADIAIVIGKIEAGDWLDPSEKPISWSCVLYDPDGECVGDGDAHTEASPYPASAALSNDRIVPEVTPNKEPHY
jgi:hypothetical protein